ncbi:hypothetical protein [Blastococcus xanthinilyticus]|uniref:N-acetylmuramoyl-L-alanine amidase n=1 Tax=Blastococcus xanthinilyticus TaxID=1564164 RepID=A0A5S5CLT0_9ACTN|nr:hypothetical protein [Blastococcus xanthinilyticus]TYP82080.1 hypothetical protein BD833_12064 [Blastococcus xanthinilyticus]
MAAYLTERPPAVRQWYAKRNRSLTGCTVLHTAESIMDSVGPDTGAENVANFIRTRTTAGSYHDLVDSDSAIHLVEYHHGAYHDGTGSNNWALSISFACATTDWARMSPAKRRAFLRQGAIAFKRQQDYRRSVGAPLTELRRITKAQSDAGMSGFIYHGDRDPGRRTDPGVRPPAEFPFDEFITECLAVMAGEEDDMDLNTDRFTNTYGAEITLPTYLNALEAKVDALLGQTSGDTIRTQVWDASIFASPIPRDVEAAKEAGQPFAPISARNALLHAMYVGDEAAQAAGRPVEVIVDEEEVGRQISAALPSFLGRLTAEDVQAIADAVADEQDRRARDGDPATGSVS